MTHFLKAEHSVVHICSHLFLASSILGFKNLITINSQLQTVRTVKLSLLHFCSLNKSLWFDTDWGLNSLQFKALYPESVKTSGFIGQSRWLRQVKSVLYNDNAEKSKYNGTYSERLVVRWGSTAVFFNWNLLWTMMWCYDYYSLFMAVD